MMPISVIAAAGIFLGLAAAMQNPAIMGEAFVGLKSLQLVLGFIRNVAGSLFGNLPLFFAIAAAIGMAKDEKPTAAFAAVIGFISMHVGINYSLIAQGLTPETTSVAYLVAQGMDETAARMYSAEFGYTLGIFTYHMSVLGGVIAGLTTVYLHNRFHKIVLPTAINFFGGRRFVPIITVVVLPIIGVLLSMIWPAIGAAIVKVGQLIGEAGVMGTWLYAFAERLLIPTGLHHILNETVRFTPIGGVTTIDGESVVGALNIFNSALTHPGQVADSVVREATRFLAQGKIPTMMFSMPAAALAMYHCARPEHKERVKALMIAGALASFVTGITEPLEFSFIFVSPILFVFHAIMSGLSFALMQVFGVMIGNVQGGVIDLLVFGVLGGSATAWWYPVIVGLIFAPIYYFTFRFVINYLKVQTPGREVDTDTETSESLISSAHGKKEGVTAQIIEGLGGHQNIQLVDCCFTRLRVKLKDMSLVNDSVLKTTGANGIIKPDEQNIQVVYGPQVEKIANDVRVALA
ncbi:PTS transporter subunit EIIC [Sansalvadorimonas verongulae]|uniref:PTS transporter subunit EIIC n=1 Tax=Sansalvadorimonas verongulae TaxID=2172824 RepID=UPI001E51FC32|nr:PTS transporter subunit EIIC [Sansalvadorimonas verongulae]